MLHSKIGDGTREGHLIEEIRFPFKTEQSLHIKRTVIYIDDYTSRKIKKGLLFNRILLKKIEFNLLFIFLRKKRTLKIKSII